MEYRSRTMGRRIASSVLATFVALLSASSLVHADNLDLCAPMGALARQFARNRDNGKSLVETLQIIDKAMAQAKGDRQTRAAMREFARYIAQMLYECGATCDESLSESAALAACLKAVESLGVEE